MEAAGSFSKKENSTKYHNLSIVVEHLTFLIPWWTDKKNSRVGLLAICDETLGAVVPLVGWPFPVYIWESGSWLSHKNIKIVCGDLCSVICTTFIKLPYKLNLNTSPYPQFIN
jgi:hypothetical protein